ncbi:hypothetical protein LUZ60_012383 [Juncus effusus]|nr:hypothetical protein LUZ60_012383 [Juncus effusus]
MEVQSESTAPARNSAVRSSTKLRYPLRSAGKVKEAADSSAQKRVAKPSADVSKSVSVLEPSNKDKKPSSTLKPPRRLSIPTKPNSNSNPISISTPNSNLKPNGSNGSNRVLKTPNPTRPNIPKSETPASNGSTVLRRKFSIISSVSYWTTQIKLAESANKHNVSLGFFKLAFESGCEPLDRMKEELKSYIITHNLSNETSNSLNEILSLYNITENLDELKLSNPKKSDSPKSLKSERNYKNGPVLSSSVVKKNGNLKPRSLNVEKDGGNKIRVSSSIKNVVKNPKKDVKNPKKVKKEKKEENEEKENENSSENNMLVEECGSTDDIPQKQEVSDKEICENLENESAPPYVELSSEEEKENTVDVPIVEAPEIVLEA